MDLFYLSHPQLRQAVATNDDEWNLSTWKRSTHGRDSTSYKYLHLLDHGCRVFNHLRLPGGEFTRGGHIGVGIRCHES